MISAENRYFHFSLPFDFRHARGGAEKHSENASGVWSRLGRFTDSIEQRTDEILLFNSRAVS